MPKKLLDETLGSPKKEEPRLLSWREWRCLSSSPPKKEAAMERAPGDLERDLDLDLDLGRRKTDPDLLRRLLEEPWCLEWWDLRLITDAESQPSRKPMVNCGNGRGEVEQLCYIIRCE